ncbi:MAG: FecR domain-containing protein [Deltaproteobacteria bacterium]|nr:FecR domain-containing protein [Deltaproteobacteria bacterium]
MSAQDCRKTRPRLAELALGGGDAAAAPAAVQAHLAVCPACRREFKVLRAGVAGVRDAEPPAVDEALMRRQIAAATRGQTGEIEGSPLAWWMWRPVALTAAAGVLILVGLGLWWGTGRTTPAAQAGLPVLVEGELQAGDITMRPGASVRLDQLLEAPLDVDAKVRLADGSAFRATGGTRFTIKHAAGARVTLAAGRVDVIARKQRPDSTLAVATTEGEARVVGTRFSVARRERDGSGVTTVAVAEGAVQVTGHSDGKVRVLRRGESIILGVQQPQSAPVVAASRPAPASTVARPARIPDIRTRIRQGRVQEGRALIEQARLQMPVRALDLAELAMTEAEVELAEGRQASAIERYLDVVARYPRTTQAEQALFAAAQLSVNRAPRDCARLLDRYLKDYPRGRFTEDVRRLQRALEQRRQAPASGPGAPPARAP